MQARHQALQASAVYPYGSEIQTFGCSTLTGVMNFKLCKTPPGQIQTLVQLARAELDPVLPSELPFNSSWN